MQCPVDNETLVMADRSGVEIDYCPKCRGVWLDRGELDKIIDRAAAADLAASRPGAEPVAPRRPAEPPPLPQGYDREARFAEDERERRRRDDDDDDDRYRGRPYKKRESFLGELFDF